MLRIYLSGRLTIEAEAARIEPDAFPGQQGRAFFARLAGDRGVPVGREAAAEAVWPATLPTAWRGALSSIASKIRVLLASAGLDGGAVLRCTGGCYEMLLPPGAWIDHEAAAESIHEAEAALKAGDPAGAYGPSAVAHHIARRPFMPEVGGRWFDQRRERLEAILVRALECRAGVYLWNREYTLAAEAAQDVIALRPFRETAYQLLMRAHAGMGNAAEALRTYERCRGTLVEELGVGPSPQTKEVFHQVLHSL